MIKNYVSICSGIGAFESAIQQTTDWQCLFASEIDEYAQKSYQKLYPDIPLYGDIWENIDKVPKHDLLVAGIPCQSFSNDGKREGLCDTRGTLFFAVESIVQKHKPKVVVIENVQGLVTHDKGKTLEFMLSNLNSLGYLVDFEILNTLKFGLPQSRERFFLVAIQQELIQEEKWSRSLINLVEKRKGELSHIRSFKMNFPFVNKPSTIWDILEDEWEEKFLPSKRVTDALVLGQVDNYLKIQEGVKRGWSPAYYGDAVNTDFLGSKSRRGRIGSQIANTLTATTSANQSVVLKKDSGELFLRRLTPLEYWRLQGFTDEQFYLAQEVNSNAQLYKQAGNSISIPVLVELIKNIKSLPFKKDVEE